MRLSHLSASGGQGEVESEPLSPSASGSVVTVRRGAGDAVRGFFRAGAGLEDDDDEGARGAGVVGAVASGGVVAVVDGVAGGVTGGAAAGAVKVALGAGIARARSSSPQPASAATRPTSVAAVRLRAMNPP